MKYTLIMIIIRNLIFIYLDFKKAFDTVPHKKLMIKVRALGIGGTIADWIENWLTYEETELS